VALLPQALGKALHAEELVVAEHPREGSGAVACGIGSPLLEHQRGRGCRGR